MGIQPVSIHGLWVPRGIVVLSVIAGKAWYFTKVRLASKPSERDPCLRFRESTGRYFQCR